MPGAKFYHVYYAQDENFTTTEIPTVPSRPTRCSQLRLTDNLARCRRARPARRTTGTSARARHRPTAAPTRCPAPRAAGHAGRSARHRRRSRVCPPPTPTPARSPSAGTTTTTPTWPRRGTARSATRRPRPTGSRWTTTRRSRSLDRHRGSSTRRRTRPTTELYPDGTYFWRVQASDAEDQGLTWSAGRRRFTKSSPPVVPSSPVGGARCPGTTPFRWNAAGVRRVVHGRGLQEQRPDLQRRQPGLLRDRADDLGYAPTDPIPASNTPYLWRVRRADAAGNLGPWSATASFISSGTAPTCHAQGRRRRSAADRVLRVDRGTGSGEVRARTSTARPTASCRPWRPRTPPRRRRDRHLHAGA